MSIYFNASLLVVGNKKTKHIIGFVKEEGKYNNIQRWVEGFEFMTYT